MITTANSFAETETSIMKSANENSDDRGDICCATPARRGRQRAICGSGVHNGDDDLDGTVSASCRKRRRDHTTFINE